MPTEKYNSLSQAYQALTDIEIADDSKDYPIAVIRVPKIGKIKITMLSEWDYYNYFQKMQQIFLSYYASQFVRGDALNENESEDIKSKVNLFINELNSIKTDEELVKKSNELTFLFDNPTIRQFFFKNLKKMGILPWYLSWTKYQKRIRPIDTMTIFIFLWAFNVDGLKKNAKFLMRTITQVMSSQSSTVSNYSSDFDSWKAQYLKAKSDLERSKAS